MASESKIDWAKIRFGVLSSICAGLISYIGRSLIHENYDAMNVLVTVFSILAGFLIAVISVLGDPSLFRDGSWRLAEIERKESVIRLTKHKWLFTLYLISLGIVFALFLIKDKQPFISNILEILFLFFGSLSFIFSLQLPATLMRIQEEKIEREIEKRKKAEQESH